MLAPQRQQFHSIRVPYLLSLIAKAINFKEIIISKDSNLKLKVKKFEKKNDKKMNIFDHGKDFLIKKYANRYISKYFANSRFDEMMGKFAKPQIT